MPRLWCRHCRTYKDRPCNKPSCIAAEMKSAGLRRSNKIAKAQVMQGLPGLRADHIYPLPGEQTQWKTTPTPSQ